MFKCLRYLAILGFVVMLGSCNINAPNENAQVAPEAEEQEPAEDSAAPAEQISASGTGLGDPKQNFDEEYGEGIEEGVVVRYDDDYLHVTFIDDRAVVILVQPGMKGPSHISKAEALEVARPFLPDDAVEQGEAALEVYTYAVYYSSETMPGVVPEDWLNSQDPTALAVSFNHEDNDPSQIFSIFIAPKDEEF